MGQYEALLEVLWLSARYGLRSGSTCKLVQARRPSPVPASSSDLKRSITLVRVPTCGVITNCSLPMHDRPSLPVYCPPLVIRPLAYCTAVLRNTKHPKHTVWLRIRTSNTVHVHHTARCCNQFPNHHPSIRKTPQHERLDQPLIFVKH